MIKRNQLRDPAILTYNKPPQVGWPPELVWARSGVETA